MTRRSTSLDYCSLDEIPEAGLRELTVARLRTEQQRLQQLVGLDVQRTKSLPL
jgi:hypothetical protein